MLKRSRLPSTDIAQDSLEQLPPPVPRAGDARR